MQLHTQKHLAIAKDNGWKVRIGGARNGIFHPKLVVGRQKLPEGWGYFWSLLRVRWLIEPHNRWIQKECGMWAIGRARRRCVVSFGRVRGTMEVVYTSYSRRTSALRSTICRTCAIPSFN